MPIVDYERIAQRHREKILESKTISTKNKEVLKRFLRSRRVSSARNAIFLERIFAFLERFPDVEEALADRSGMNRFFGELEKRYSPSTYATYVNVARCFLRWVNDGERPSGLKDITPPPRAATRRCLNPEDLLDWQDVMKIIQQTTSVQLKALVTVQFDGGLRPSELHDLNVGDIRDVEGLLVAHVRRGKTGSRQVILHRSSGYLQAWLDAHPEQSREAPLWISEFKRPTKEGSVLRYNYPAMRMRVMALAKRAGISKAVDFYGLRHASCAADKRDNLPIDIGAARHGHSVKHFTETYGALSVESTVQRIQQHYGRSAPVIGSAVPENSAPTTPSESGIGQELVRLLLNEMRGSLVPPPDQHH